MIMARSYVAIHIVDKIGGLGRRPVFGCGDGEIQVVTAWVVAYPEIAPGVADEELESDAGGRRRPR
jgi:hypothetical protein